MTETLKDGQQSSPEAADEASKASPSNPLWTYVSFLFLLILTIVMSFSIYELYYGNEEDRQLSADIEKAFEKNQVSLDLLDARLRADLLGQFVESKQATIARALAKLASRPNQRDLNPNQRLILLNARQAVLNEAEHSLKDGRLTRAEKITFIELLQTALDQPERLLEKVPESSESGEK